MSVSFALVAKTPFHKHMRITAIGYGSFLFYFYITISHGMPFLLGFSCNESVCTAAVLFCVISTLADNFFFIAFF